MTPVLVWFRLDLRLADHPALEAAAANGAEVIPIFIWSPQEEEPWPPGAASRWWLHYSLERLADELARAGSKLILRRGPADQALSQLIEETGASRVFWSRRYEPAVVARDRALKQSLAARGTDAESFSGSLLFEPWNVLTKTRKPFQVFSAFWKACLAQPEPAAPVTAIPHLRPPVEWPSSLQLHELDLLPKIDWAGGMRASWTPGEKGAQTALAHFVHDCLAEYPEQRNIPADPGTSRLSPHLHFGEVSPRAIWHAIREHRTAKRAAAADSYLREIGWREFAYHLLFHFPQTTNNPLRAEFAAFPWRHDDALLRKWQRGATGYPLIDAGMRELWATGWMHNRVRMLVASFLVKDLQLHWEEGAYWFWDTLVDADLANNTLGWQWSAGCGADAAPYFRILNPVLQGQKFDAQGEYVRRWVPELARLPERWVHQPWDAPDTVLAEAGIRLGVDYPRPLVDHADARQAALKAFASLRQTAAKAAK